MRHCASPAREPRVRRRAQGRATGDDPGGLGAPGLFDDRRADAVGWGSSFDVSKVRCPVIITRGEGDTIVPVLAAHHTKSRVPQAEVRTFGPLGHQSMVPEALKAAGALAKEVAAGDLAKKATLGSR